MAKVYQEYQKAANRHLKTCIELRNIISKLSEKPEINKKLIKNVTEDLYYLSGYIIECSCCMLIYFNFDISSKKDLKATKIGHCLENIAFTKPQKEEVTDDKTLYISNTNHEMRSFQDIYKYLPDIPINTPLINGSLQVFERANCKDLFFNWGAEVRYSIDITLTTEKTLKFLEIATNIYTNIDQFVNNPKRKNN
jgi:hypothetical protein